MKTMNYSIIRCICALVLGVLLVAWPEAAILYLVITIGALFLVPGLFSVFGYLTRGKQNGMSFPIAGLGSLLFGLWLMIMPAFFVGILMYVLGAVLHSTFSLYCLGDIPVYLLKYFPKNEISGKFSEYAIS